MADYTPSADFDFTGISGYTPEADFDFNISTELIVTGVSSLGAPGAVAVGRWLAWLIGVPAAGSPQALVTQQAAILQPAAALGAPGALASQQAAIIQGQGALGTPQALSHFGYLSRLQAPASLGTGQALGHYGYLSILQAPDAVGTPQATAFALPAVATDIPQAITYYYAKLTGDADGLTDVTLPMSSFSVRHRYDGPSYYQLTIPTYAYVSAIAARPNGEIVIWSKTGEVEEELLRGDLGNVRTDRGPKSQSISISGNSDRATTDPATYLLSEALYASTTFAGDSRLRIKPRAAMRPGDYIRYVDINFAIGEVVWSVAVSAGGIATTMEVSSLPVTDGGTVPSDFDNLPYTEVITSNAEYQYIRRSLAVPAGTYRITTTDIPGLDSGDLDLYVKFNAAPNKLSYDCKAETLGEETCEITTASAATLHVLLLSYTVPATVTLTVSQL